MRQTQRAIEKEIKKLENLVLFELTHEQILGARGAVHALEWALERKGPFSWIFSPPKKRVKKKRPEIKF